MRALTLVARESSVQTLDGRGARRRPFVPMGHWVEIAFVVLAVAGMASALLLILVACTIFMRPLMEKTSPPR